MAGPTIIVLAAGISSRMKQVAGSDLPQGLQSDITNLPKAMLPFGGDRRPFLDYLVSNIWEAGHQHCILVVADVDESIRSYYAHRAIPPGCTISFVTQTIPQGRTKPLGTAEALLKAIESHGLAGHATVCNSDNLYSVDALRDLLTDNHENALIAYDRDGLKFDEEKIRHFALVQVDRDWFVTDLVEKPTDQELALLRASGTSVHVSMNIFRLQCSQIMPYLHSVPLHPDRNEKELPVAIRMMVKDRPRSLRAIPRAEHVVDLTRPSDIPLVQEQLRRVSHSHERNG